MGTHDLFELQRFVDAQNPVYADVVAELGAGKKESHWMWFVFPQLIGLSSSEMARKYAIRSYEEAAAYWAHPVLGPRLKECASLVLAVEGKTLLQIMGPPDNAKFGSCMTLFGRVAPTEPVFQQALHKYCDGQEDPYTVDFLAKSTNEKAGQ